MFSDSIPEELAQARQLLNEGKLKEAHVIITNFEEKGEITPEVQLSLFLIRGKIHLFETQYNKAIEAGDQAYQLSQQLGSIHGLIQALCLKGFVIYKGKVNKGLEMIIESEKLMASLPKESISPHFQQEIKLSTLILMAYGSIIKVESENLFDVATQCLTIAEKIGANPYYIIVSNVLLGWAHGLKGDSRSALDYAFKSLELSKKLNLKALIAYSLVNIGSINYYKRDLSQALAYCKQSLSTKGIGDMTKILSFVTLGEIYREKADLDKALKYLRRGANLAEKLDSLHHFSLCVMYIGSINRIKGNFDQAISHLERSLALSEKEEYSRTTFYSLLPLIFIYLDKDSVEDAHHYFLRLKELVDKMKSKPFTLGFMFTEAMILKKQRRTINRAEAEKLLKQVIEEANNTILDPWVHIMALTTYCEHLLEELIIFDDSEILKEINPLITQILETSESQNSYSYLAEAKVLQSKLLLIQRDMGGSKKLLTEAQRIAELHGLNLLSQKISHEHDNLLEQSDIWGDIIKKNAPISDRIKLASINGVIDRLKGKRAVNPPEMVDEQPTLLLIIAEGGGLIFSHPFTEESKRDDTLFSSFLSAFTSFSHEFFTKGLDRAKFGDDFILMQSVGPFSICYLFKGQSYPATQRLTRFTEQIQSTASIWQALERFYKTSQVLELKDNPSLDSLITEIFIDKKISV
ncbi:MAG: tetratricopeptide repeat protein [Promethearchaeota archaeon]|jgi:tetratricopeptide (TPR) repeat protein